MRCKRRYKQRKTCKKKLYFYILRLIDCAEYAHYQTNYQTHFVLIAIQRITTRARRNNKHIGFLTSTALYGT
jgi:hypothetical protein